MNTENSIDTRSRNSIKDNSLCSEILNVETVVINKLIWEQENTHLAQYSKIAEYAFSGDLENLEKEFLLIEEDRIVAPSQVNDVDCYELDLDETLLPESRASYYLFRAALISLNSGHYECFEALVDRGVSLKDHGLQLLDSAIATRKFDAVQSVIKVGAIRYADNSTLVKAVDIQDSEILYALVKHGNFDSEVINRFFANALMGGDRLTIKALVHFVSDFRAAERSKVALMLVQGEVEIPLFLIMKGYPFPKSSDLLDRDVKRYGIPWQKNTFIRLCEDIITIKKSECSLRELSRFCGSSRDKLKSDAFPKKLGWQQKHFVQVVFHAAYVASILCPDDHDAAYGQFVQLIKKDIDRVEDTKGMSWRKYGQFISDNFVNLSNFKDVIEEVTESVALPLVLAPDFIANENKLIEDRAHTPFIHAEARRFAVCLIGKSKTTLDFSTLNRKWHLGGNRMPSELRPLKMQGSWPLLFEPQCFKGGYEIVALHTPEELKSEGDALSHCVGHGHYNTACEEGDCQIISIRHNSNPVGTIQLSNVREGSDFITPDGRGWSATQKSGAENVKLDDSAEEVYEKLLSRIDRNKVKFFPRYDMETIQSLAHNHSISKRIGYSMNQAADIIPRIIEHYRSRIVVPKSKGEDVSLIDDEARALILEKLSTLGI